MSKLTVIVTAFNNTEGLRYTLESLCEQSSEEFDVLIVQCGAHRKNEDLIREYCNEYVGFAAVSAPKESLIPDARNVGAAKADSELLLFMTEGDYLAPESVESFLANYEETKADILCPRLYISGENEPYYLDWADMLATVPHIGKFDEALLNTLDAEGRVYKKKFFDLYSLRFPSQPILYNAAFLTECVYRCDAALSGVAGAIYDTKSTGVFLNGFARNAEPNSANLKLCCDLYDGITEIVKTSLEEETGAFTGEEYTFQEILFIYFTVLTDRFYRFFWYLKDEDLNTLREKYEALSALMTPARKDKIPAAFKDLRFPSMYMSRKDAAALPMVSLLLDLKDYEDLPDLIRSLYLGRFPFFEVFLPERGKAALPAEYAETENMHVLPDAGFFGAARAAAVGVPVNVKSAEPLDPKVLSELSVVKAPVPVYQYIFASKRKKYAAKTYLKKKGMSMH